MIQDAVTLPPRMHQWVENTTVISTIIFTYQKVHEYGYFHFCARRLAVRLSVASALTPRRPSTKATKGVNCLHSFKQVFRYFHLFSRSLLWGLGLIGHGVSIHDTHVVNNVRPLSPKIPDQQVPFILPLLWQWFLLALSLFLSIGLPPLNGTTCKAYEFVAHMCGGEGLSCKVGNPTMELFVTLRD